MRQNATPGDELATLPPDQAEALEPAQEIALAALLAGQSASAAAEASGCHRSTLWRWIQTDPRFMARLYRGRHELAEQARAELLTLSSAAVRVLRETLENGESSLRFKAAVKTLELLGCDRSPRIGPIAPAAVVEDLEEEAYRKAYYRDTDIMRKIYGNPGASEEAVAEAVAEAQALTLLRRALGG